MIWVKSQKVNLSLLCSSICFYIRALYDFFENLYERKPVNLYWCAWHKRIPLYKKLIGDIVHMILNMQLTDMYIHEKLLLYTTNDTTFNVFYNISYI